jgi:hypothetical protein
MDRWMHGCPQPIASQCWEIKKERGPNQSLVHGNLGTFQSDHLLLSPRSSSLFSPGEIGNENFQIKNLEDFNSQNSQRKIRKSCQIAAIFSSSRVCRPEILKDAAIFKNSSLYLVV